MQVRTGADAHHLARREESGHENLTKKIRELVESRVLQPDHANAATGTGSTCQVRYNVLVTQELAFDIAVV